MHCAMHFAMVRCNVLGKVHVAIAMCNVHGEVRRDQYSVCGKASIHIRRDGKAHARQKASPPKLSTWPEVQLF